MLEGEEMSKEAMKLALEALEAAPLSDYSKADGDFYKWWYSHMQNDLMQPPLNEVGYRVARYIWDAALRDRLAQPEQEPKCGAIIEVFGKDWRLDYMSLPVGKHKLYMQQYNYTAPPQRKPLTVVEIMREWRTANDSVVDFARAIEAAHGIKGEA
jgi:hypothetical protein